MTIFFYVYATISPVQVKSFSKSICCHLNTCSWTGVKLGGGSDAKVDDDQHTIKQAERDLLLILTYLIHLFVKWQAVGNHFVYHLQMVIQRYRMNSSGLHDHFVNESVPWNIETTWYELNKYIGSNVFFVWVFFHEFSQFTREQGKGVGWCSCFLNSSLPLSLVSKTLRYYPRNYCSERTFVHS